MAIDRPHFFDEGIEESEKIKRLNDNFRFIWERIEPLRDSVSALDDSVRRVEKILKTRL